MNTLFEILPLLVPVLLIDIALAVAAVRHILRHPRYRFGNKTMWLVIVCSPFALWTDYLFCLWKGENE